MEAIGSILLNPRKLQVSAELSATSGSALADDVLNLAMRLAYDAAHGGRALAILNEAASAVGEAFMAERVAGFDAAASRMQAWLNPARARLINAAGSLPELDEVSELLALLVGALRGAAAFGAALSTSQVRAQVAQLVQVVTVDLGVNNETIETLIDRIFEESAARLRAASPDPDPHVQRNRLEMAAVLRRLRRRIGAEFRFPVFNTETITRFIMDLLDRVGLEDLIAKINCVAEALETIIEAGTTLVDVVPFTGMGTGSIGPAIDLENRPGIIYAWYASWLLGDYVWVNEDHTRVMRGKDTVLHEGVNLRWYDAPIFAKTDAEAAAQGARADAEYYTFAHISPSGMEAAAYILALLDDLLEFILHGVSAEQGDFVNNLLNLFYAAFNFGYDAFGMEPVFARSDNDFLRGWLMPIIQGTLTFAASFEGMHTRAASEQAFIYWSTLLGADVVETALYSDFSRMLRSFFLSLFTLINHRNPPNVMSKPGNYTKHLGWVEPFVELSLYTVLICTMGKENYVEPFTGWQPDARRDANLKLLLCWPLASFGVGALGGMVGGLFGQLIAFNWSWREFGLSFVRWEYFLRCFLKYWVYLFLRYENDTDGGTYNATGGPAFAGYPAQETSPYLLPYEGSCQCAQGHKGFWSHHDFSFQQQIYAVDFALDQGELILASRAGVVQDFFDWVPDNTDPGMGGVNAPPGAGTAGVSTGNARWNFISIRHTTVDPAHDRTEGGAAVTTIAVYGHGRQGSVRRLFAEKLGIDPAAITPAMIVNRPVAQGEPIIECGDTGVSAYNHLHMHILPQGGTQLTLPFVFRECGVPKSLDSYASQNTRV
ncbi:MAG: hypothetical protein SNJ59_15755 [Aggregatilineales bacterium]